MEANKKQEYCKPEIVEFSSANTYGLTGMDAGKSGAIMEDGMSGMGVS
jgi:hypothetical protein